MENKINIAEILKDCPHSLRGRIHHGIPVYRHCSDDIQERQHPSRQERLGIRQTKDLLSHTIQRVGYGKEIR